jgi:hypothetical protein
VLLARSTLDSTGYSGVLCGVPLIARRRPEAHGQARAVQPLQQASTRHILAGTRCTATLERDDDREGELALLHCEMPFITLASRLRWCCVAWVGATHTPATKNKTALQLHHLVFKHAATERDFIYTGRTRLYFAIGR